MARPRQGEVRDHHVAFRLTIHEAVLLRERAAAGGQTVTDYARDATLAHRPHAASRAARHPFALEAATFHAIRRLGVNLNQIAHRLNALEMPPPPELAPLMAEIHAVLKKALAPYGA